MTESRARLPLWPVLLCQVALAAVSAQAWHEGLRHLALLGAVGWCVAWVGFIAARREHKVRHEGDDHHE